MFKRRILPLAACLALLAAGGLSAQSASTEKQPPAQKKTYAGPHITGTVVFWNGNRMDLKTPDGKEQQVAVNKRTERLVEIAKGAEVTVDYRRKIGDFVIALRVRPAEEGQPAAQSPGRAPQSATGTVISANQAELLLRTASGDVTFFLSPSTQYMVKPLNQGRQVTVEYQVMADGSKLVSRVLPAGSADSKTAAGSGGPKQ